jgi:ketosteroid isomerase-like protein
MMSENKETINRYMEGYGRFDRKQVMACLTDDVEWLAAGVFHVLGKEAFYNKVESDAFVGLPTLTITRMVEENDVVIAEGEFRIERKSGGLLTLLFCDVFEMKDAKIRRLISYVVEVK